LCSPNIDIDKYYIEIKLTMHVYLVDDVLSLFKKNYLRCVILD